MQTLSDLQAQCQAVNLAFQKRIEETVEAKTKLEQHLEKVNYRLACLHVYLHVTLHKDVLWRLYLSESLSGIINLHVKR